MALWCQHPHSRISARNLGTVKLTGGQRQVTYYGRPLYYYRGDHRPGNVDIHGERFSHRDHGQWSILAAGSGRIALPSSY